jgi:hypothetical protein
MLLFSEDGAGSAVVAEASKEDRVTPIWQLLVSGAVGSLLTFGFSWWRERRRSKDAYYAPQRTAIGDIVTVTATVMVRELEARTYLKDLVQLDQEGRSGDLDFDVTKTPVAALGISTLDAERAFQIGSLSIVDAPCFEAFGAAYFELTRLRQRMALGLESESPTAQQIEEYVAAIKGLAVNLNTAVTGLAKVASKRVTPAETLWNPYRRRKVRQRLGKRYAHSLPNTSNSPN